MAKRVKAALANAIDALDSAADYSATVTSLYDVLYASKTGKHAPEEDAKQCAAHLAAWFPNCAPDVVSDACALANALFDATDAQIIASNNELEIKIPLAFTSWNTVNSMRRNRKGKHPLGPIVRAWAKANPPVTRKAGETPKRTAVLPSILAQAGGNHPLAGKRFTISETLDDDHPPTLPVSVIFNMGRKNIRATPKALRIWETVVLDADIMRAGYPQVIKYTQEEFLDMILPNGYAQRYTALRDIQEACLMLERMLVPIADPAAPDKLIGVPIVTRAGVPLQKGAHVYFRVHLPRACQNGGPSLDRELLRKLASESAVLHRTYLNLMLSMYVPGKTLRPPKNGVGMWHWSKNPLDYGRRLLTDKGEPVDDIARKQIIQTAFAGEEPVGNTERVYMHRALKAHHQLCDLNAATIHDGRFMPPHLKTLSLPNSQDDMER